MVWIFLKDGYFDSKDAISIKTCESMINRPAISVLRSDGNELIYFCDTVEERNQEMDKIKSALLEARRNGLA